MSSYARMHTRRYTPRAFHCLRSLIDLVGLENDPSGWSVAPGLTLSQCTRRSFFALSHRGVCPSPYVACVCITAAVWYRSISSLSTRYCANRVGIIDAMSVEKIYSKSYNWEAAQQQAKHAIARAVAMHPNATNLSRADPKAVFGLLVCASRTPACLSACLPACLPACMHATTHPHTHIHPPRLASPSERALCAAPVCPCASSTSTSPKRGRTGAKL